MGSRVRGRDVGQKYVSYAGYSEEMGITRFQDFLFESMTFPSAS